MSLGILGTKEGMTQLFDADTRAASPVTVIHADPNVILRHCTEAKEGYSSIQVGFLEKNPNRVNRPDAGQFARASAEAGDTITPRKHLHLDSARHRAAAHTTLLRRRGRVAVPHKTRFWL